MKGKGVFICIEGLDGCGKTTQTKLLVKKLRKKGYDAVYTAEPTRGKIGTLIRKYCLHGEKRVSPFIEALLFAADRLEHLEKEVYPALRETKVIVSDRYIYSSLAYQGSAEVDLNWIKIVNRHALPPDLAIFIDVEPETVMKRLKLKKSVMETFENQKKVREIYLQFVKEKELVKIDGNKSKKEVADSIMRVVTEFLEKKTF